MDLTAEERLSDSPFVETIWHSHNEKSGDFTSIANTSWGIVIGKVQGQTVVTVRGPETRATPAFCPPDAEFYGIQFKLGTIMPDLPARRLMDRCDAILPEASSRSFWLKGSAWPLFDFDNAESFVDRLVRDELLVFDPIVGAALQGHSIHTSLRTVQRRFLQATGLTHGALSQIKRARYATKLLKQGVSILDTVDLAAYADQPHLTRSLKHYIGQTPAQIADEGRLERLSFLFKTEPLTLAYDSGVELTVKG